MGIAYRRIMLVGSGNNKEALADGAITPGHLLERTSAGKFKVHSSAGQPCARLFAVEDGEQGNGIATAYTSGNQVQARACASGEEVYAILADGENVSIGDFLESNGNGELKKYVASSAGVVEYPNSIVGMALAAINASDSAATAVADRRIRIEIV